MSEGKSKGSKATINASLYNTISLKVDFYRVHKANLILVRFSRDTIWMGEFHCIMTKAL